MTNDVHFPPNLSHPHEAHLGLGNCDDPYQPVLAMAAYFERGVQIGPCRIARAQLAFTFDGLMRVEIGEDRWFIPDRHGLWIPPGERHLVTAAGPIELQTFYVHSRYASRGAMPQKPTVVRATPMMRGIARRLAPSRENTLRLAERRRLAWVALDEMARLEQSDLRLPGARDPRVAAAMAHLLEQPSDARNLARLAEQVGTSERTLSRLFPAETGLSWREWRDRLRFLLALEGLQEGQSSTSLARGLGYSTPSAFVAAFRRRAGMTPMEWRKRS
ncbi:MAG: helix-turn-helix transcriptional regulator [Rhodobacteraceae bacterium]|nr:helix-turn-helix transcriptional regulator [Paracoccaceae bacterium]MCW9043004.1 helix-turn-helix transcriptional regulator [Pseudopelagicola sp.]